jgi:hypothetical protein
MVFRDLTAGSLAVRFPYIHPQGEHKKKKAAVCFKMLAPFNLPTRLWSLSSALDENGTAFA